MIDALRRRADTHTPSNKRQDEEPTERTSFLGLPQPYGGFLLPSRMINSGSRGLLTCFFWCGRTEGIEGEEEEEENLCIGMPDVSDESPVGREESQDGGSERYVKYEYEPEVSYFAAAPDMNVTSSSCK